MAASINKLLMNIDFPVFVVKFIGPKHFLIAGGGGPSSTGVPNGLVRKNVFYCRLCFINVHLSLLLFYHPEMGYNYIIL